VDIGKFLSLKDFFNYYISGAIWIADFLITLLLLPIKPDLDIFSVFLTTNNTIVQTILTIAITGLLPYSMGFVMSEVGDLATEYIHQIFGNPVEWVVDYSINSCKAQCDRSNDNSCKVQCNRSKQILGVRRRRIPEKTIELVASYANELLGIDQKDFKEKPDRYLFQLRAYVVNKAGGASDLATRTLDLANFAESILIPLPLLLALCTFYVLRSFISETGIAFVNIPAIIFATAILSLAGLLVIRRYLSLKENWVKHIYRGFVVIASFDLYERKKNTAK